jgi:hypothetical protein
VRATANANRSAPASSAVVAVRRAIAGCLAMAVLALGVGAVGAQESLESSVKAAYLYKLLGFVEWPPSAFAAPDAPHVIGVMGNDEVLAELQRLVSGRNVHGRPIVATRIAPGDSVDLLHVLYVGRGARAVPALRSVAGRPVLTVADAPGALAEGAILNFLLVRGRVRFEASLPAAERAGVRLSARLLAVAERVVTP